MLHKGGSLGLGTGLSFNIAQLRRCGGESAEVRSERFVTFGSDGEWMRSLESHPDRLDRVKEFVFSIHFARIQKIGGGFRCSSSLFFSEICKRSGQRMS